MLALVLLLALLCLPLPVLEVSSGGTVIGGRILMGEATVSLSYVHSVERTPVVESYQAGPGGLRLTGMRWQSFGAGLPEDYDDFENGFYVKHLDIAIGRRLDYWFLPVNRVSVAVESDVLFEEPDEPALVTIRVRLMPLLVAVA